jgi:hypothetical protein
VARLRCLAEEHGRRGLLAVALNSVAVAGVGGGTVSELSALGVRSIIELDRRFFLRRLVSSLQGASPAVRPRRPWQLAPPP